MSYKVIEKTPTPSLGRVSAPWWDDKPLAIVGCGPSLKGFDFRLLDMDEPNIRVLAVKESIWDLPFAAAVFSLDRPWINRKADEMRALAVPKVFAVEPEYGPTAEIDGALYLLRSRFEGLSDDPGVIQSGANSGFGAFNYGYLKRAKRIALFGFDFIPDAERYNQDRYTWQQKNNSPQHYWQNWGDCFSGCRAQLAAAGVAVMNASPISTIKAFDKCTIEEGLRWLTI